MISWNSGFSLLALLCTIPTAFLAFKPRFEENLKNQYLGLIKTEKQDYTKDIRLDYRILASVFYGITKDNWHRMLMGHDNEIVEKMEHDKSDAVRGLGWFCLFFIFALLSLFLSISNLSSTVCPLIFFFLDETPGTPNFFGAALGL